MISAAVMKDLLHGPAVRNEKDDMQSFMTQLRSCHVTLSQISEEYVLDDGKNLVVILKRLPRQLQLKWLELIGRGSGPSGSLTFQDLIGLIEMQLSKMCVEYGDIFCKLLDPPEETYVHCVAAIQSCNNVKRPLCILCSVDHGLESCPSFVAMDIEKRRKVLSEHKRCFVCLKANHLARLCKSGNQCNRCGGRHHELVHLWDGFSQTGGTKWSETISTTTAKEPPNSGA